ncbi:ComEC/Rec2 family competence protein [Candidatus Bipolaricaulota bacterium]
MRKILLASIFVILATATLQAAQTLDVYFIDVGHGDAVLLDCGSWEALIDAGGPSRYCPGLSGRPDDYGGVCIGCYMPLLRSLIDGELELAILTHNHEDHFGGFSLVFEFLTTGEFLHGERLAPKNTADSFETFLCRLAAQSFILNPLTRGDRIQAGDLLVTTLNPAILEPYGTDHNHDSLVLLVEYGQVAFLLAGDIQTPT